LKDKPEQSAKNTSRRKLLTTTAVLSAAVGTGEILPGEWTRPVVEAVLLPAHANISGCSGTFCDYADGNVVVTISAGTVMATVGTDSGNGPPSPDGTFSFALGADRWIEGTITPDCSEIQGGICNSTSPCSGSYDSSYLATPKGCDAVL
jgi:hypothetical protein